MLIAWARGKKGRDHQGYEDEIVSSIFGPMRYFNAEQKRRIVEALLIQSFLDLKANFVGSKKIETCEIQFWPNIATEGRVEPDISVLITHHDKSETTLLIEAKWNSKQNENQLHEQWIKATAQAKRANVLHIYLTKEPHDYAEMEITCDVHKANLVSLTWSRLASIFKSLNNGNDSAIYNWVSDVQDFLTKLGHAPFYGVASVVTTHNITSAAWASKWTFQPLLICVSEASSFEFIKLDKLSSKWNFNN